MSRWIAAGLGIGFVLLPQVLLPLSALRARPRSAIPPLLLLLLGALAWVLPVGLREPGRGLLELLQLALVAAAWQGMHAARRRWGRDELGAFHRGLALGLLSFAVVGTSQVLLGADRATGWAWHPNLWAVAALFPCVLLTTSHASTGWTFVGCSAAIVGVGATGSRSAALALAFVLLVSLVRAWRTRDVGRSSILGAVLASAVIGGAAVLSGVGPVARFLPTIGQERGVERNLLINSEDPSAAVWIRDGVEVAAIGDDVWRLTKTEEKGYARLAQRVVLQPGTTYTYQVRIRSGRGSERAGIVAWGRASDGTTHVLEAVPNRPVGTRGTIEAIEATSTRVDGWVRRTATFRSTRSEPLAVRLGVAPFVGRGGTGTAVTIAAPQFEVGPRATAYEPTDAADRARDLATSSARERLTYARVAMRGFTASPWVGSPLPFEEAYTQYAPDGTSPGSHAHSWLHVPFERGLLGVVGLSILLVLAVVSGGPNVLLLFAVALIANVFDYPLTTTFFVYPFAGALGWDSARHETRERASAGERG